ncbi:MAG: glucuronate isomerase [Bacteroidetes bacterium GWF2_42_66]|nr:MAG: glucuronate isomerase [Bacteroidetes bacterium GWA2_42_15]OFY02692.1 MAG: glucuronate isomerase [Bacteroidetes bacterium GWE2_42_39]OFY43891.1 MAG: glucuronate isomerase [Bacteroidetes bacterium GWF2_42_66]HBL77262.1 glucuronate isomerase [Prolixibacteraceae bacterium]HCU60377.1 glucuronate isomerase [Prolixibacteraceae bacterium]
MKKFMDENFLLKTETAQKLYHNHAAKMPIFDYHCHINPKDIADDRRFKTITEIWLAGDHYKWRAMRTNGIDERFCTGNASDWEKFEKWAETVPYTLRNPLYHWTHLELKKFFGIDEVLSPKNARKIYDVCNEKLNTPEYSCRNIIRMANVHTICTTDDPIDTLEYHQKIKADGFEVAVLPAWRPDKAMMVEDPKSFNDYMDKLAKAAEINISNFGDLIKALDVRHQYFHDNGCRLSDHGLDTAFAEEYTEEEIKAIFKKIRGGNKLTEFEILKFKSCMLYEFGIMDHSRGWTQQFHIGAQRNNNTRLFRQLGPDTGFDSIGDKPVAEPLARLLDHLDQENKLCKTILYNLNPRDNELYATMLGNFQDGSVPGKIQYGSGWWFLDQKDGMEKQMNDLSNLGLLSRFVGMLTDSRSFLSYTRHEYFRRTLCNLLGNDVENGEIPADMELLGNMVENISFNNAKNFFNF